MMRVLRRQVRRLRRALMADRPPQERTVVIIAGLGLMADDKTRAVIRATIDKVQRKRGNLPSPPAIAKKARTEVTGPAPPMSPEQIEKFWEHVEAESKRHEAEIASMIPRPWPPYSSPAQGLDFDQMVRWRPRGEPDRYPPEPDIYDPLALY